MTTQHPQHPNAAADTRGIRDIVLAIEAQLHTKAPTTVPPPRRPITREHAARLTSDAADAIDMVLSDCRAKGVRISFRGLVAAALEIAPDCGLTPSGQTNMSIRNLLAERAGVDVSWGHPS